MEEVPKLPRAVLSLVQFTRPMLERCMDLATLLEHAPRAVRAELARGKILAVMFYQQSTRTRMSFEAAMLGLGGHVVGFADPTTTRAVGFYEETLEDVVRFTAVMSDIMVLRHPETGSANRAASVSPVPIINAGDGYGEHPTQALGDVYHLRKHFGRVDGLKVGIVGHLGWRAHRSLAIALSLFNVHLFVLEPPGFSIPEDVDRLLQQRGIPVHPCTKVTEILRQVDVVTTLGVHHSNFHADFDDKANLGAKQEAATPDDYRISATAIAGLGRFVPVLHIGPIADHIDRELDAMPQAHYFRQARDCVWMRSALLASMLREAS
jgi:aspartate carbamoyltransferase catalytic subunit